METVSRPVPGDAATASKDISEIKVDTANSNLVQYTLNLQEVFALLFTTNQPNNNSAISSMPPETLR